MASSYRVRVGASPALRGGSGFGGGTTVGFSRCDGGAVERSDRLGETAAFDGRETMGASSVCADATTAVATTRTRLPRRPIIFGDGRGIDLNIATRRDEASRSNG